MLGMTREEVQGKRCYELIGKDQPCDICATSETYETKEPSRVERYEGALGIWLDVRAYPVLGQDGELLYVIEHLRDITKEKGNEQKLKFRISLENVISSISTDFINMPIEDIDRGIDKSLERIAKLVNADRSYVFLYRENGTIMDNTHEWCEKDIEPMKDRLQDLGTDDFYCVRQLRSNKSEIVLSDLGELPDEAGPDREEFEKEGIQSLVLVPLLSGVQDIGFIGFDSVKERRRWNQDTITLLKIVGETIVSALLRREAQEELIIERNRAELYLDLLGHDIGNIHQGIHTSLQLARLSPRDEDRKAFAMNSAQELTNRSIKLVHNVLLLSKLRSKDPELMPIRIDDVLDQASRTLRDVFPNKKIDLIMNCPPGITPIMAEPIISELFFNLMHNGIKFQENGAPVVEIDVLEIDDRVQITVADHGPGIPDDLKEQMFQRFNKGGNGSQTGLGLSLVKALVDRYSGTIAVMDRVIGDHSQGALFLLSFPKV
jgi:signal transduction histidine kinase